MDLTTLGVKLGYASATANGTRPTAFTWLKRAKSIGAIDLSVDSIDVTAIEDLIKQYADGAADTGGKVDLTFGVSNDVIKQLETYLSAGATAKIGNKEFWHVVWFPALEKSFYFIATPGTSIGMPEVGVGNAAEIKMTLVLNEYKGLDTAVEPTAGE